MKVKISKRKEYVPDKARVQKKRQNSLIPLVLTFNAELLVREAIELKNVTKSGKSPQGGGGVRKKHQKVQNSKFGLFDKRGGGYIFIFSQM